MEADEAFAKDGTLFADVSALPWLLRRRDVGAVGSTASQHCPNYRSTLTLRSAKECGNRRSGGLIAHHSEYPESELPWQSSSRSAHRATIFIGCPAPVARGSATYMWATAVLVPAMADA